jgi:hypothetical protein
VHLPELPGAEAALGLVDRGMLWGRGWREIAKHMHFSWGIWAITVILDSPLRGERLKGMLPGICHLGDK